MFTINTGNTCLQEIQVKSSDIKIQSEIRDTWTHEHYRRIQMELKAVYTRWQFSF